MGTHSDQQFMKTNVEGQLVRESAGLCVPHSIADAGKSYREGGVTNLQHCAAKQRHSASPSTIENDEKNER